MKNPQNQGTIPRFFNCLFNPAQKLTEAITWRKLNVRLMLRIRNLLIVAFARNGTVIP